MIQTKIENIITKNAQVIISLDWTKKLLKDFNDIEGSVNLLNIEKQYKDKVYKIMDENNIKKITVYPKRDCEMTFSKTKQQDK